MAKKFNGMLQYTALFIAVFLLALLLFAFIFSIIFPNQALRQGPVSPYFSAKSDGTENEGALLSDGEEYELSKLISVYEKMSAREKMELYSLFSKKLSNSEIEELFSMTMDGVDENERRYFNSLAAERLTAEDIGKLTAIYKKYS